MSVPIHIKLLNHFQCPITIYRSAKIFHCSYQFIHCNFTIVICIKNLFFGGGEEENAWKIFILKKKTQDWVLSLLFFFCVYYYWCLKPRIAILTLKAFQSSSFSLLPCCIIVMNSGKSISPELLTSFSCKTCFTVF